MCSNADVMEIFYIFSVIINLAKIILPLVIIVMTTIDFYKVVINPGADTLKKSSGRLITRLITAALIFFVPTIVNVIFDMVDDDYSTNNITCLLFVSREEIDIARIQNAYDAIVVAEKEVTRKNYNAALHHASKVRDPQVKAALFAKLEVIDAAIKQKIDIYYATAVPITTNQSNISGVINPNSFVYYNQCSNEYRNITYNGANYNTCNCGCGFTSLAMVIDNITKSKHTPIGIVNSFPPNSYAESNCAIYDNTLVSPNIYSKYNVQASVLFSRERHASQDETTRRKNMIVADLKKGHLIILLVPGHYITLGGIDTNEKIFVYDPANSGNNGKYSVDELYEKYKNHKNRCNSGTACGFVYAISYYKG